MSAAPRFEQVRVESARSESARSESMRFNWLRVAFGAARSALHWRALLLWWASLSLVALVAVVPVFQLLDAQLSHAIAASGYAHALDLLAIGDLLQASTKTTAPRTGVFAALFFTALLWPWLTGVMVAAVRLGRGTSLFVLAAEGMREYGRQLRILLWSLLPLAPVIALGYWLLPWAAERAETMILASSALWLQRGAQGLLVVLFLLVYVLTDLTRARIAVHADTRSVVKAWWRSLKVYLRRPFATWCVSLLVVAIGLLVLAALGIARVHASGAGWSHFALALLLGQCVVIATGWLRLARLHALARLIENDAARRASAAVPMR